MVNVKQLMAAAYLAAIFGHLVVLLSRDVISSFDSLKLEGLRVFVIALLIVSVLALLAP